MYMYCIWMMPNCAQPTGMRLRRQTVASILIACNTYMHIVLHSVYVTVIVLFNGAVLTKNNVKSAGTRKV